MTFEEVIYSPDRLWRVTVHGGPDTYGKYVHTLEWCDDRLMEDDALAPRGPRWRGQVRRSELPEWYPAA